MWKCYVLYLPKWSTVSEGVPFRSYLYVPEVHDITGDFFLEREDEGHVFKVIVYFWYALNRLFYRKITGWLQQPFVKIKFLKWKMRAYNFREVHNP